MLTPPLLPPHTAGSLPRPRLRLDPVLASTGGLALLLHCTVLLVMLARSTRTTFFAETELTIREVKAVQVVSVPPPPAAAPSPAAPPPPPPAARPQNVPPPKQTAAAPVPATRPVASAAPPPGTIRSSPPGGAPAPRTLTSNSGAAWQAPSGSGGTGSGGQGSGSGSGNGAGDGGGGGQDPRGQGPPPPQQEMEKPLYERIHVVYRFPWTAPDNREFEPEKMDVERAQTWDEVCQKLGLSWAEVSQQAINPILVGPYHPTAGEIMAVTDLAECSIRMQATVHPNGSAEVFIVSNPSTPGMERLAYNCLLRSRWLPGMSGGQPVDGASQGAVSFTTR